MEKIASCLIAMLRERRIFFFGARKIENAASANTPEIFRQPTENCDELKRKKNPISKLMHSGLSSARESKGGKKKTLRGA
jgi:hypothetical protein